MTVFRFQRAALAALVGLTAVLVDVAGWPPTSLTAQEPKMIKEGQPAPNVDLPATQIDKVLPKQKEAKSLKLKDLQGKNVVLYFFPKAATKG